jgi:hypothetical protein
MLLCVGVSISGWRFGRKLCVHLQSSLVSATLVPTIWNTCRLGCFSAWSLIIVGILYNFGGRSSGEKWWTYFYSV